MGERYFGRLRAKKSFKVGDLVNLPQPPDPSDQALRPTKGHVYRVAAVADGGVFVVEYVSPWAAGLPECTDTFHERKEEVRAGRLTELAEDHVSDPLGLPPLRVTPQSR